jgi:hypothetical protein
VKAGLAFVALAAASACSSSWSTDQRAAIDACLNAATQSFPTIDPTRSNNSAGIQMGDLDQAELTSTGNGGFVLSYPNSAAEPAYAFVCRGNLAERRIDQIDSGSFVARGENNAGWRY